MTSGGETLRVGKRRVEKRPVEKRRVEKLRVMLAGDHPATRLGARLAFETDVAFEIVGEARRGADVLPLVGRSTPDVLLVDVQMAGFEGLDGLARLHETHPEVRVIVSAASSDPQLIAGAFRRGACGYVLRATDPVGLASTVRQAVEGTAYHAIEPSENDADATACAAR
jgi:two-component system nitrate/nitrite response regulator NarP